MRVSVLLYQVVVATQTSYFNISGDAFTNRVTRHVSLELRCQVHRAAHNLQ